MPKLRDDRSGAGNFVFNQLGYLLVFLHLLCRTQAAGLQAADHGLDAQLIQHVDSLLKKAACISLTGRREQATALSVIAAYRG